MSSHAEAMSGHDVPVRPTSPRAVLERRAQELARPVVRERPDGEDALRFTAGGQQYALPLAEVVRVVPGGPVARVPLSPPSLLGMMNLGGALLAVFALQDAPSDQPTGQRPPWVVVVDEGLGIAADAVTGVSALAHHGLMAPPDAELTDHPVRGLAPDGTAVLAADRLRSWDRFRPYAADDTTRPGDQT